MHIITISRITRRQISQSKGQKTDTKQDDQNLQKSFPDLFFRQNNLLPTSFVN